MKRITLTFMILLSVFFTIWVVKMKHPINRPENVKEDTETPWYETKYQAPKADDEWTLDPEIPLNYIPVPGEDELYMVVDDSGNITNYRKRVKQADGCIIAIIPFIVSGLTGLSRLSFFGTSIIITVSVILETKKLILSKTQENYYMNRVKKGGLFRG